jgi:Domain of unknown function (DUF4911)
MAQFAYFAVDFNLILTDSYPEFSDRMTHTIFTKRYFRIARAQIAYLRFILESYDGLAFVRTLDSREALIEIGYPLLRTRDAEELLEALIVEIGLVELPEIPKEIYKPI